MTKVTNAVGGGTTVSAMVDELIKCFRKLGVNIPREQLVGKIQQAVSGKVYLGPTEGKLDIVVGGVVDLDLAYGVAVNVPPLSKQIERGLREGLRQGWRKYGAMEAGVLLKIDQMPLFLLIAVVRTTVAFTVGGRQLVVETFKARDLVPAITQVAGGVH